MFGKILINVDFVKVDVILKYFNIIVEEEDVLKLEENLNRKRDVVVIVSNEFKGVMEFCVKGRLRVKKILLFFVVWIFNISNKLVLKNREEL